MVSGAGEHTSTRLSRSTGADSYLPGRYGLTTKMPSEHLADRRAHGVINRRAAWLDDTAEVSAQ